MNELWEQTFNPPPPKKCPDCGEDMIVECVSVDEDEVQFRCINRHTWIKIISQYSPK